MIRAIHFPDLQEFKKKAVPGSIHLRPRAMTGLFDLDYFCPCGCGVFSTLLIGNGYKPGGSRPSWIWNGSKSDPNLKPSVHHVGHWHGYLRDGYWVPV